MTPKPGDCGFTYRTDTRIFNTMWPKQNGRHFADDVFKCIFLTENFWFSNNVWLKFVHRGSIENVPSFVQIMACRLAGASLYLNQRWSSLLTHTCVTRPRWVKGGKIIKRCVFSTWFYQKQINRGRPRNGPCTLCFWWHIFFNMTCLTANVMIAKCICS